MTILPMVELGTPCLAQSLANFSVISRDSASSTSRSFEIEWTPIFELEPKYRFAAPKKISAHAESHSSAT